MNIHSFWGYYKNYDQMMRTSAKKMEEVLWSWLESEFRNSKTILTKSHVYVYLGLDDKWREIMRNWDRQDVKWAGRRKIRAIERAFKLIEIRLLDGMLDTLQGKTLAYNTQFAQATVQDKNEINVIIDSKIDGVGDHVKTPSPAMEARLLNGTTK